MSSAIYAARARIAYHSRRDVGNPAKADEARRELAIVKLEAFIGSTLETVGPLTKEEQARLLSPLLSSAA